MIAVNSRAAVSSARRDAGVKLCRLRFLRLLHTAGLCRNPAYVARCKEGCLDNVCLIDNVDSIEGARRTHHRENAKVETFFKCDNIFPVHAKVPDITHPVLLEDQSVYLTVPPDHPETHRSDR